MTFNQTLESVAMNSTGVDAMSNEDDWFMIRFAEALVDAVWEQSQSSTRMEFSFDRFGGIIRYCCSIYGATCLIMALVLNRTLVIASTNNTQNQQAQLYQTRGVSTKSRLSEFFKKLSMTLFRLFAITSLVYNGYHVLVALNLNGHISINCNTPIAWFYKLIPDSIFAYDSAQFADNRYMSTPKNQVMIGPTTDMYWPIFLNFCLSSFAETFHSVISGRKPYTESGITIFEHSLAFQEFSSNGAFFFGSSKFHKRPTEQVLVATLFSILTHLNIHIGGLINNSEYRLIPSTILGVGFLSYFVSSIFNGKFFGFPSILILTFVPQVLIIGIISISCLIFILAVIANGFRIQDLNYASFLSHENSDNEIEYTTQNSNIHLNDDFYTAILNLVMLSITSAGKSSYITELSIVSMDDETWIERNLWDSLRKSIGFPLDKGNQNYNVIDYMKKHNITGYDNLISKPSKHLISGSIGDRSDTSAFDNSSVLFKRIKYLRSMLSNFFQLLIALVKSGIRKIINKFSKPGVQVTPSEESMEEFEKRKAQLPQFLSKYMRRRAVMQMSTKKTTYNTDLVNVDELSITEVESLYHQLLSGKDILEIDGSADYVVAEDSDYESELEGDGEPPINELITATNFTEMLTSSSNSILQHHMASNIRLTRSRYNEILNHESEQDIQTSNLVQMLVVKRIERSSKPASSEQDSRLDCVICQVNTREIITWPCKCFAICESCRLSLVSKGIEGCVCCRRNVEGVSKVFIP